MIESNARWLWIVMLGCLGCGSSTAQYVEGKVTLDGTPLANAIVSFSPAEGSTGSAAMGRTDENGVYTLTPIVGEFGEGADPGSYLVSIAKTIGDAYDPDENFTDSTISKYERYPEEEAKSLIPVEYNNAMTSGLKATIEKGKNLSIDFELSISFKGSK